MCGHPFTCLFERKLKYVKLMKKNCCLLLFMALFTLMSSSLMAQSENLPDAEDAFIGDSTELFDMEFEDLVNLQVTTASKTAEKAIEAPAVLSVIHATDIEAYGANSLGEILERVTGAFLTSSFQLQNNFLSFRGDPASEFNNHLLILIDGRPARESISNGTNFSIYNSFPIESIQRIEIIRGPGSVLYGTCAYMGVINIITRSGEGNKLRANAGYGMFQTLRMGASGSYAKKDLEIQGGANLKIAKGWNFQANDQTAYNSEINKEQRSLGAQLKIKYKNIKFSSFFASDRQNGMERITLWNIPPDYRQMNYRLFTDLGYEKELKSWWKFSVNATYNRSKSTSERFLFGNNLSSLTLSNDILGEMTHYFTIGKKLNLTLGGIFNFQTGKYNLYSLTSSGEEYDVSLPELNPNPLQVLEPYQISYSSLYTQIEYKPQKWIKLVGGIQANKVPLQNFDFTPRFSFVINTGKSIYVKGMLGTAFRSASAIERRSYLLPLFIGTNLLNPEKIMTAELQIAYARGSHSVGLTVMNTTQTNLISVADFTDKKNISVIDGVSVPRFYNSDKVTYHGLELEGQTNLKKLIKGLTLTGSCAYYTAFRLTNTPQLVGKLGIAYKSEFGLHAGLFNHFYGKQGEIKLIDSQSGKIVTQDVNPEINKNYIFTTLNIGFDISTLFWNESELRESMSLDFYVVNLFNTKVYYPEYQQSLINSIPGRAPIGIYARLSFKM